MAPRQGGIKMKFPASTYYEQQERQHESRFYPNGDERRETVPVSEFERVAEPTPITGEELAGHRKEFADYVFDRVSEYLIQARYKLRATDWHDGVMAHYLRAYGYIVRALELEPSPFTTDDSPALTALFWDLKGIRAAMERGEPVGRIDKLIGDLIDETRNDRYETPDDGGAF